MTPAAPCRHLAATWPEVTAVATDTAAAPLVIRTVTGSTCAASSLVSSTVEISTAGIEPSLSGSMTGTNMAIMTGGRAVTIGPAGRVAGIAGLHVSRPGRMATQTMAPTRPVRSFGTGGAKMAGIATDAAAAATIVTAVAGGAGGQVRSRCRPMITTVVFIQPGLTGRMTGSDMTVMARVGTIAILPIQIMTGGADAVLSGQRVMGSRAMTPDNPFGNLAAGRTEVAGVARHSAAAPLEVCPMASAAGIRIEQSLRTVVIGVVLVQPGLTGFVIGAGMAVVAEGRAVSEGPSLRMTGVTDRLGCGQCRMVSVGMGPTP